PGVDSMSTSSKSTSSKSIRSNARRDMPLPRVSRLAWLAGSALVGLVAALVIAMSPSLRGTSRPPLPPPVTPAAPAPPRLPPMSAKEREFIWQVEHHFNVLGQHGFSALARALKQADEPAIRKLLAADFR